MLNADRIPFQVVVRIFLYFGLMIGGGASLAWLTYEQGLPGLSIFETGLITGVCVREANNMIRFFGFLPVAKQIMSREKIDELLRRSAAGDPNAQSDGG